MTDTAHGIRASLGPSGLRVDGPRSGAPTVVLDVHRADGTLMGAVYGPVSQAEAGAIVHTLGEGGDPGGPDAPWIAVAAVTLPFVVPARPAPPAAPAVGPPPPPPPP